MEDQRQAQPFAAKPINRLAINRLSDMLVDQKILFASILVALTFHVLMFPVVWFIGWALPWPKSSVVTTIVDFDLQQWLKSGKPKRVIEFRDPALNK